MVVDAMSGQDALHSASRFQEVLDLTGFILTKLDGDARGGAALSIRAVTDRPIKYAGHGEGLEALEPFHPERMASRILGMGDVLTLVEKAQAAWDRDQAEALVKKIRRESFTLEDFRAQIQQVRQIGPIEELLGLIPGMQPMKGGVDFGGGESRLTRFEAILNSMTREERQSPDVINGSRRRRIARGSGTTVSEVNQLLRQFQQTERLMRQALKGGRKRSPMASFFSSP